MCLKALSVGNVQSGGIQNLLYRRIGLPTQRVQFSYKFTMLIHKTIATGSVSVNLGSEGTP